MDYFHHTQCQCRLETFSASLNHLSLYRATRAAHVGHILGAFMATAAEITAAKAVISSATVSGVTIADADATIDGDYR